MKRVSCLVRGRATADKQDSTQKASTESAVDTPGCKRSAVHVFFLSKLTPQMIQGIELDEEKYKFDEKDDVFSISNVLKQCELDNSGAQSQLNA